MGTEELGSGVSHPIKKGQAVKSAARLQRASLSTHRGSEVVVQRLGRTGAGALHDPASQPTHGL